MTAQASDRLINEHPSVKFRGLNLYAIVCGDIRKNHGWGTPYRFVKAAEPPAGAKIFDALRGYVATFRLGSDGELQLVSYFYPHSLTKSTTEEVGEKLSGDFWMVLKHNFFSPRIYVPFKDGKIVEDASSWETEERRQPKTSTDGEADASSEGS